MKDLEVHDRELNYFESILCLAQLITQIVLKKIKTFLVEI